MVYSRVMTETMQAKQQYSVNEIRTKAAEALARGGTVTYIDGGLTVKIFYVANGAFCRIDTRTAGGVLLAELSGTKQWTNEALNVFEAAVTEAQRRAVQP